MRIKKKNKKQNKSLWFQIVVELRELFNIHCH
mgnify:CR=1 FL=1